MLAADITKIYRQIQLDPRDRQYQKILWREDPTHPIRTYQLNTVTYGTAAAPYSAAKALQLATDEKTSFPRASTILKSDFYMDDLITGSETYEEPLSLR